MARRLKLITGLSTVAVSGAIALSACGERVAEQSGDATVSEPADRPAMKGVAASAPLAAPASGEGEGGVDIAAAATDPVVFLSALAIAEAHVVAARDAYAAGRKDEAAGMFAHPVSEVLADMEGAFTSRGVQPLDQLFIEASEGALANETPVQIAARTDAIIAALLDAARKAPDDGRSEAQIAAGVASDQIDRAVDMYRLAASTGEYGPYLDGYGFFKAAESVFTRSRAVIERGAPEAGAKIEAALSALGAAYPGAGAPAALNGDIAALSAASSRVMLSLGH